MGSYVELLKACKEGNQKKVKKLLGICKNIGDVRDLSDKTLLHYCFQNTACTDLILEIAPELLDVGEKSGYTVLHLASMMKPPTPLPFLISKNPDINKKTNELRTPLLLAVLYDNYDAVKILCSANAEVNVTDCLGVSPLHYAAKAKSEKDVNEQTNIIDILLEYQAKIEFPDSFERSPLIWAVSSNNIIKMRHLLTKGANINARDVSGLSVLHYATSNGNIEIIETLLREYQFDINTVDNNQCTPLMYACTMNQHTVVKALLDNGANVNLDDIKKRSAVHFACGKGDIAILKILAEHGADLWQYNEDSNYPLHEACFKGHEEIVLFFMSHPNQENNITDLINRKNNNGQTSLHLAAVKDHLDICRILLENGADPNVPLRSSTGKSMTALDLANKSTTKELIIDYDGKTADELTSMCPITEENSISISDHSDTDDDSFESSTNFSTSDSTEFNKPKIDDVVPVSVLKEELAEIEVTEALRKFLFDSCYSGNIDAIRSYSQKGVQMNDIIDSTGKNLLHYSFKNTKILELLLDLAPDCINKADFSRISVLNLTIMSKENDSLKLLLPCHANYNFPDDLGRTSLHLAVIYNNITALQIIDDFVADKKQIVQKPDSQGNYPIHYAIECRKSRGSDYQSKEFIELLLTMNGDIECRDKFSRSPLLLAVNISNIEAVITLLEHGADVLARDNHCMSSIHYVCAEGNTEIFNILSRTEQFDPDIQDQNGLTPIFYAVASCNDKIVQQLIQLSARIDITDTYGRNLCHKASEKGAFKCLELLLLLKVDPWLKSNDGSMPLHEAAYRGYKEVADILLNLPDAYDYVNAKNVSGQTALHLAAARNDCPMCYLLISKGSSVNELLYDGTNDTDVTAYDLATTPYCKDTLFTFGGRSAKRILDDVSVVDMNHDVERLTALNDILQDNSIIEPPYSVRSTELALSTLPSRMNNTARSADKSSLVKQHTTKASSKRTESNANKKCSCGSSRNSLLISPNNGPSHSVSPTKESSQSLSVTDDKDEMLECVRSSKTESVEKSNSFLLSVGSSKSKSKTVTPKSSKASRTSFFNHNHRLEDSIEAKVHTSIQNYEFIRLNAKIACDIARRRFRMENVEKLINPKTPKSLRRVKLT